MKKYRNRQFHFSFKDMLAVVSVMVATVLSLLICDEYGAIKEKYNIRNTQVDYIIQTPSEEQITEMENMQHINSVVPYYYCACNVEILNKTVRAEMYLIEKEEQLGETLFSDALLIQQEKVTTGNAVYIDSVFADKHSLSAGDKIHLRNNESVIECIVAAVYGTDGRHDNGMLMAIYTGEFVDFVNPKGTLKYSGAYLGSANVAETEKMLKEYVPMGDLRSRDEFDSDDLYNAYLELKQNADSSQTTFHRGNYLKEVENRYDARLTRLCIMMYGVIALGTVVATIWLLLRSMRYVKKDILKDIRNNFSEEQEKEMIKTYYLFASILFIAGSLISAFVTVLFGDLTNCGVIIALNVGLPILGALISLLVTKSYLNKTYYKAMGK